MRDQLQWLATNVKQLRVLKHLKQVDLAPLVPCSVGTLTRLESGRGPTLPTRRMLDALARAFGVSVAQLLAEPASLTLQAAVVPEAKCARCGARHECAGASP